MKLKTESKKLPKRRLTKQSSHNARVAKPPVALPDFHPLMHVEYRGDK
jgi:hypothetical protein